MRARQCDAYMGNQTLEAYSSLDRTKAEYRNFSDASLKALELRQLNPSIAEEEEQTLSRCQIKKNCKSNKTPRSLTVSFRVRVAFTIK